MIKRVLQSLIFVCVLSVCVCAAIPAPGPNYANDFANVLSSDIETHINETSRNYSGDGTQVVVVTVTSLDGMDIESYANKLFRSWGIGDKDKDNGLLILVSTGDRKIRIEVGRGLEGTFNDAKCGRLIDEYAVPYLKENNYDFGIKRLYDMVIAGIDDPVLLEETAEEDDGMGEIIAIFVIIVLYLLIFNGRGGRGRFVMFPGGGFGGGGFSGGSSSGGSFGGFGGGSSGGGGASRGF